MGVYSTVFAELLCARCGASYSSDVQFRTGDDRDMPEYTAGQRVAGPPPGAVYEGTADALCPGCAAGGGSDPADGPFRDVAVRVAEDGTIRVTGEP